MGSGWRTYVVIAAVAGLAPLAASIGSAGQDARAGDASTPLQAVYADCRMAVVTFYVPSELVSTWHMPPGFQSVPGPVPATTEMVSVLLYCLQGQLGDASVTHPTMLLRAIVVQPTEEHSSPHVSKYMLPRPPSWQVGDEASEALFREWGLWAHQAEMAVEWDDGDGPKNVAGKGNDSSCVWQLSATSASQSLPSEPTTLRSFHPVYFEDRPSQLVVVDIDAGPSSSAPAMGDLSHYPDLDNFDLFSHACGYCWEFGVGAALPVMNALYTSLAGIMHEGIAELTITNTRPLEPDSPVTVRPVPHGDGHEDHEEEDHDDAAGGHEEPAAPAPPAIVRLEGSPVTSSPTSAGAAISVSVVAFVLLAIVLQVAPFTPAQGLFSRIDRHEVLDHPRRSLLWDYLRENPGATYAVARRATGLGSGPFIHHLRTLERTGHVRVERDGPRTTLVACEPVDIGATKGVTASRRLDSAPKGQ